MPAAAPSPSPLPLRFRPQPAVAPDAAAGETSEQYDAMVTGQAYLAADKYLHTLREHTARLLHKFNNTFESEARMKVLEQFVEMRKGDRFHAVVVNPFICEYGSNISLGDDVFIGPNCTFLDVCPIYVGRRTMIAANTQLYTPSHPISPEVRNGGRGPEWAAPITIGDDCWIGGGVIILPGVTIGNGATVGAGSVVTRDVEARTVVVGNPAKVVKRLPLPDAENGTEDKPTDK